MKYSKSLSFENLNVVHRLGEFYRAKPDDIWRGTDLIFEQNKFYYILEGTCTIIINGHTYIGKRGDWFFIPANHLHSFYRDDSAIFSKHFIHFDIYPGVDFFYDFALDFKVTPAEDSEILSLFERASEIAYSSLIADKIELKSIVLKLLSEYIRLSSAPNLSVNSKISNSLLWVISYIEEHLTEELPNDKLAEISHLHTNHFIRIFKEKMGRTPQRYIMQKRMNTAKRLIDETSLSFTEIAELSGVCDVTHLSKAFKAHFGMTPSKYRKIANSVNREEVPYKKVSQTGE